MVCENSLPVCSTVSIQEESKLALRLLYVGVTLCSWLSVWTLPIHFILKTKVTHCTKCKEIANLALGVSESAIKTELFFLV
jgi:hypothetical protein